MNDKRYDGPGLFFGFILWLVLISGAIAWGWLMFTFMSTLIGGF